MDRVFDAFLQRQLEDGSALAAQSDLLELLPFHGSPPDRYLVRYRCRGLVRSADGEIVEAERFDLGVWFPHDYLRRANPFDVVTWFGPPNVFHPNLGSGPGGQIFICIGRLAPGAPLVDILEQCFEIITYQKATLREDDALDHAACAWARRNQHRLPIDPRPLRRRRVDFAVETTDEAKLT
jgi:hypothetical protein